MRMPSHSAHRSAIFDLAASAFAASSIARSHAWRAIVTARASTIGPATEVRRDSPASMTPAVTSVASSTPVAVASAPSTAPSTTLSPSVTSPITASALGSSSGISMPSLGPKSAASLAPCISWSPGGPEIGVFEKIDLAIFWTYAVRAAPNSDETPSVFATLLAKSLTMLAAFAPMPSRRFAPDWNGFAMESSASVAYTVRTAAASLGKFFSMTAATSSTASASFSFP